MSTLQRLQDRASIVKNAKIKDLWPVRWLTVEGLIRYDRFVIMYKIYANSVQKAYGVKYQQRIKDDSFLDEEVRNTTTRAAFISVCPISTLSLFVIDLLSPMLVVLVCLSFYIRYPMCIFKFRKPHLLSNP